MTMENIIAWCITLAIFGNLYGIFVDPSIIRLNALLGYMIALVLFFEAKFYRDYNDIIMREQDWDVEFLDDDDK